MNKVCPVQYLSPFTGEHLRRVNVRGQIVSGQISVSDALKERVDSKWKRLSTEICYLKWTASYRAGVYRWVRIMHPQVFLHM